MSHAAVDADAVDPSAWAQRSNPAPGHVLCLEGEEGEYRNRRPGGHSGSHAVALATAPRRSGAGSRGNGGCGASCGASAGNATRGGRGARGREAGPAGAALRPAGGPGRAESRGRGAAWVHAAIQCIYGPVLPRPVGQRVGKRVGQLLRLLTAARLPTYSGRGRPSRPCWRKERSMFCMSPGGGRGCRKPTPARSWTSPDKQTRCRRHPTVQSPPRAHTLLEPRSCPPLSQPARGASLTSAWGISHFGVGHGAVRPSLTCPRGTFGPLW